MKKVLIVTSTASLIHNSGIAFNYLTSCLQEADSFICDTEKYSDCSGCKVCTPEGICCKKDSVTEVLKNKYTDFIFICPAYFFDLKSDISRFIDRMYFCNLNKVNFHFLIFTGSSAEHSGIDVIRHRFQSIDSYCGTHTTIRQVVTGDKILSIDFYRDRVQEIIEEVFNNENSPT